MKIAILSYLYCNASLLRFTFIFSLAVADSYFFDKIIQTKFVHAENICPGGLFCCLLVYLQTIYVNAGAYKLLDTYLSEKMKVISMHFSSNAFDFTNNARLASTQRYSDFSRPEALYIRKGSSISETLSIWTWEKQCATHNISKKQGKSVPKLHHEKNLRPFVKRICYL